MKHQQNTSANLITKSKITTPIYYWVYLLMVPFLISIHEPLLTTFHAELSAVLCMLPLLIYALYQSQRPVAASKLLPHLNSDPSKYPFATLLKPLWHSQTLAPAFLFFIVLQTGVHVFLKQVSAQHFIDGQILVMTYTCFMLLSHYVGMHVQSNHPTKLLKHVCYAFIILGVLNTSIMWLQFFNVELLVIEHSIAWLNQSLHWAYALSNESLRQLHVFKALLPPTFTAADFSWISIISTPAQGKTFRVFANLNQPNQANTVMALSVFSMLAAAFLKHKHLTVSMRVAMRFFSAFRNQNPRLAIQLIHRHWRTLSTLMGMFLLMAYLVTGWVLPASRTLYAQLLAIGGLCCVYYWCLRPDMSAIKYILLNRTKAQVLNQTLNQSLNQNTTQNLTQNLMQNLSRQSKNLRSAVVCYTIALLLLMLLSLYGIDYLKHAYNIPVETLYQRWAQPIQGSENSNLRHLLRMHGIMMFQQQPLWGVGYAAFNWQQFLQMLVIPGAEIAGSSHNIIIDGFAKFGLIGGGLMVVVLASYAIRMLSTLFGFRQMLGMFVAFQSHQSNQSNQLKGSIHTKKLTNSTNFKTAYAKQCTLHTLLFVALGVIGVIFTHGLFEYPQNYTFFLWPIFLSLGASEMLVLQIKQQCLAISCPEIDSEIDLKECKENTIETTKTTGKAYAAVTTAIISGIILLTLGFMYQDYTAVKAGVAPRYFFKGYYLYLKAHDRTLKTQVIAQTTPAICTLQKQQAIHALLAQGMYIFTSEPLLKAYVLNLVCLGQVQQAVTYAHAFVNYQSMQANQQDWLKGLMADAHAIEQQINEQKKQHLYSQKNKKRDSVDQLNQQNQAVHLKAFQSQLFLKQDAVFIRYDQY